MLDTHFCLEQILPVTRGFREFESTPDPNPRSEIHELIFPDAASLREHLQDS